MCIRDSSIKNPYSALRQGIGLVTENRRETGFFQNFSNKRNISIAYQLKNSSLDGLGGFTSEKREQAIAEKQREDIQIKCASLEQLTSELSGGNQQKVILGKWMASNVQLLIFDEPTKGIDVGTKSEIYKLMRGPVSYTHLNGPWKTGTRILSELSNQVQQELSWRSHNS